MKPITVLIALFLLLFGTSCGSRKKITAAPVEPVREAAPAVKDEYVPFTKELYDKLIRYGIDVKLVQFYVDQQLILSRGIDDNTLTVKEGVIVVKNGKSANEIVIPIYTKGKCEAVEADGLRISFKPGSKSFKFLNSKTYSPNNYIFSGANWDSDGTCEVEYDVYKYRVRCGSCGSAADAKLAVKMSEINNIKNLSETLPGNSVGGK